MLYIFNIFVPNQTVTKLISGCCNRYNVVSVVVAVMFKYSYCTIVDEMMIL